MFCPHKTKSKGLRSEDRGDQGIAPIHLFGKITSNVSVPELLGKSVEKRRHVGIAWFAECLMELIPSFLANSPLEMLSIWVHLCFQVASMAQ